MCVAAGAARVSPVCKLAAAAPPRLQQARGVVIPREPARTAAHVFTEAHVRPPPDASPAAQACSKRNIGTTLFVLPELALRPHLRLTERHSAQPRCPPSPSGHERARQPPSQKPHRVTAAHWLQRYSSTRVAPPAASSGDGRPCPAACVAPLPHASQGALSTCAGRGRTRELGQRRRRPSSCSTGSRRLWRLCAAQRGRGQRRHVYGEQRSTETRRSVHLTASRHAGGKAARRAGRRRAPR
jgi:hypothetical protein